MPDGRNYIEANQIIYKNVTRKHSGTYICEGSNGPGQIVSDEIQVDILHPPEIVAEESYNENNNSIQLELVCIVHASPRPTISWYKDGQRINISTTQHSNEREPRQISNQNSHQRMRITKIGRKHIFTINQIMSEHDEGTYTCHAVNEIGEAKHNFQVAISENAIMNDPVSSERENLHHDDQGWNTRTDSNTEEGPPVSKSDSIHAGGTKNDFELSSSSSRIHLYDNYLIKYSMLLFYILLRYM